MRVAASAARRRLHGLLLLSAVALFPVAADALERPAWAFPRAEQDQPSLPKKRGLEHVPDGSSLDHGSRADHPFDPPERAPNTHPSMPRIVAQGDGAAAPACATCHLPTGAGDNLSNNIAGLPEPYLIEQMNNFKTGARTGSPLMTSETKHIASDDVLKAAAYFANLKPTPWIKVVESATAPKTFIGPRGIRLPTPDGASEPLAGRIVEVPQDPARALDRDPRSGFIDYVPKGSVARGRAIASSGDGGRLMPCAVCHGVDDQGGDYVPGLAGRQAVYLVRQMFDMADGERAGAPASMLEATKILKLDDLVAIAAYLASRPIDRNVGTIHP